MVFGTIDLPLEGRSRVRADMERWDGRWTPGEVAPPGQNESSELRLWLGQWPRFVVHDGVLCMKVLDPVLGEIFQILMPKSLLQMAMEGSHNSWGHQGLPGLALCCGDECIGRR